jgi:hypothetical protein
MSAAIKCERCAGSGEIGVKTRGTREAPGPVPDDARGWAAVSCPDCRGKGELNIDEPEEADDENIQRSEP